MSGGKILDQIKIDLRGSSDHDKITIYLDIEDNSLSQKWLAHLNNLLANGYHLEKNYCFFGWADNPRNGWYILDQINRSINAINQADLGYRIDDYFDMDNTMTDIAPEGYGLRLPDGPKGRHLIHEKFNRLHRYFEDLQGVSNNISNHYQKADAATRWHIRQLNLLCHEFESWALSYRKEIEAPDWARPSQLMCWLNSPRFKLDEKDFDLFGIETINRSLGGIFVGVNKAVGKHHWEVFNDEGRDSRIAELTTTTLRGQTEASGDFDIEWGLDPSKYDWQQQRLDEFRQWLIINGFDPDDKSLTIGHPKIGQVDLLRSFNTDNHRGIWKILNNYLDVYSIETSDQTAIYEYRWSDRDYMQQQIKIIEKGYTRCLNG